MKTFKPLYNSHEVAVMVETAVHLDPQFGRTIWESPKRIASMAAGELAPSESVLKFFDLKQVRGNYVWSMS